MYRLLWRICAHLPFIILCASAIIILIVMSSCSSIPGQQTLVIEEQVDVPLIDYTTEFQSRAADELQQLPPACLLDRPDEGCSALRRLIDDYGRLRSDIRAIQNDNT